MDITVRFLKLCKWSFNGNVRTYEEGDVITVDEKNGYEMVEHKFALLVEDNLNQPQYEGQDVVKERKLKKALAEAKKK